jgi:putative transposase
VLSLRADALNKVWSGDINYLPTAVRGVWLNLYIGITLWCRRVVAWELVA